VQKLKTREGTIIHSVNQFSSVQITLQQ